MQPNDSIKEILEQLDAPADIKEKYRERLAQGNLTRDEDPTTHFCSYFFPYRLSDKKVFLVAHKKSGLWLSPGGHIDPGETPAAAAEREMREELGIERRLTEEKPQLLTITYITRDVRACTVHFDIWYFVPMDGVTLTTEKEGEFDNARWFTIKEAGEALTDESNLKAIDFVEKRIFPQR